jgi:5,6,7,8-tetrahydromethanopterin hydro-lyase
MNGLKIGRVLVGEVLVGEGNEPAHIDLIMGPRGSAAELAVSRAVDGKPGIEEVIAQEDVTHHPLAAHD